jgi:hypothetical protein
VPAAVARHGHLLLQVPEGRQLAGVEAIRLALDGLDADPMGVALGRQLQIGSRHSDEAHGNVVGVGELHVGRQLQSRGVGVVDDQHVGIVDGQEGDEGAESLRMSLPQEAGVELVGGSPTAGGGSEVVIGRDHFHHFLSLPEVTAILRFGAQLPDQRGLPRTRHTRHDDNLSHGLSPVVARRQQSCAVVPSG